MRATTMRDTIFCAILALTGVTADLAAQPADRADHRTRAETGEREARAPANSAGRAEKGSVALREGWRRAHHPAGFALHVPADWPQETQANPLGAGSIFTPRKPTLMFNGYAEEVASLYTGLDLRRNF